MDDDTQLYDEFGNYIGPSLEDEEGDLSSSSDESDEDDQWLDNVRAARPGDRTPESGDERGHDVDMMDAAAVGEGAIVQFEDKKFFRTADEVYPDAETLVEDEDAQPLTEPIVSKVETRRFALADDSPACTYTKEFMLGLAQHPALVRSVALVGALHHGKTALVDLLVQQTHEKRWGATQSVRYTDTRKDEQQRRISLKAQPMSLVLPDLRSKSHLMQVYDTPGHVDFSDEVTAALHLCDSAVVVVDAVEGVMLQTERLLRHAVEQGLEICVCINKVDRLILELKMPPAEAYYKLRHTLNQINEVLSTALPPLAPSSAGSPPTERKPLRVSPLLGNVCFASASMGWVFSLESFAQMYAERHPGALDPQALAARLWGDVFYSAETRRFTRKAARGADPGEQRSFVQFILQPIYKLYAQVVGEDADSLERTLQTLGIRLAPSDYQLDVIPLLRLVCSRFFGTARALTHMVVQKTPSPIRAAPLKAAHLWSGPQHGPVAEAMAACDPTGPLMICVAKCYARDDCSAFDAFGRVMSGRVRVGQQVRVLGEAYSQEDEEDMSVQKVSALWVYQSRYRVAVDQAGPGTWVLLEGVDDKISKTATITDVAVAGTGTVGAKLGREHLHIFRPLHFNSQSVVKVAIEPLNPSELPKMLAGLRKLNKTFPLCTTKTEESGEQVLMGTGELYLDTMLHDLREMFGNVEVKVADPVVSFCETVAETSSVKCFAHTTNQRNKLTMIAEPLDRGLAADLEMGVLCADWPKKQVESFLQTKYNWDLLDSKSVWCFTGAHSNSGGPNVLLDSTLSSETDKVLLYDIKENVVQGLQWAAREGPLCEEPIRGCKFKLLHAEISKERVYRGGGQIIPTARRVAYSSFLLSTPRLMEPVCKVEILVVGDCVSRVYTALSKRRGHVTHDAPMPGTPLYTISALLPIIESFGFETELRCVTQGQAFCQSVFDHWQVVPGDPLDKTIELKLLEPAPVGDLAREFMVKTRRRKGLGVDVAVDRFFDEKMMLFLSEESEATDIFQV